MVRQRRRGKNRRLDKGGRKRSGDETKESGKGQMFRHRRRCLDNKECLEKG